MKIFSIMALLLTLLFSAILVEGLISRSDNVAEAVIDIEVPQAIVWNALLNMEDYEQWNSIRSTDTNPRQSPFCLATYKIAGKIIRFREKYMVEYEKKQILFAPADSIPGAFLHSMRNTISLKPLADGSTQVHWRTQYKVSTISANLINRIYVLPSLQKALAKNLQALKNHIER